MIVESVSPLFTLLWSHPQVQTVALLIQNLVKNRRHVRLSKHGLPPPPIHQVLGDWGLRNRVESGEC